MANQIKYSRFIQPDDSITNLISQLETVQSKYSELQSKLVSDAKKIEEALKKVNSVTGEQREQVRKQVTEADKLAKANKDLQASQTETAKKIALLKAELKKQTNATKLATAVASASEGTYEKLSAQYAKNVSDLQRMTKAEKENTAQGKKLVAETQNLHKEMEIFKKTIKSGYSDADRLAKANAKLADSESEVGKELVLLQAKKQKANQITKLEAKLASAAEGSYDKLSAQYSLNKIKLNAMSGAERKATESGKKLEKQTREIYEEMSRLQKATGKHSLEVGKYGASVDRIHPLLGRLNHQLDAIGTNLDDLAKADKPFKVLKDGIVSFGRATLAFLLSPVGLAITALGALFLLISKNKDTVIKFDSSLINVGKTTGLAGKKLRSLGGDVIRLSRRLKVVGTPALLDYATVAGQLGVEGSKNILDFSESLAKLETATNISGEEGASKIARFLTITDGGVENVKDFGDEIVNLGNNFAAFEDEILSNATLLAQNLGQFDVGRKNILAYATATKAAGLEAELTGSSVGVAFAIIEDSLRSGNNIHNLSKLIGKDVKTLKQAFAEDSSTVFRDFIAGLNGVSESGGSVNAALSSVGVTARRDRRVLGSLATKGFDVLERSIVKVSQAAGSMDDEFEAAASKLDSQLSRVGIAWDNLLLTIDDGEGLFSQIGAGFSSATASAFDSLAYFIKELNADEAGFSAMYKESKKINREFLDSLKAIADVDLRMDDKIGSLKRLRKAFSNIGTAIKGEPNRLGRAYAEAFLISMGGTIDSFGDGRLDPFEKFKQYGKNLNKSVFGGTSKASAVWQKSISGGFDKAADTIGEVDIKIARLNKSLADVTTGEGGDIIAKRIQDDIKVLEAKKNAILGVVDAEARANSVDRVSLEISVMPDGKSKDTAILESELKEKKKLWKEYGIDNAILVEFEERERKAIRDKYRDIDIAERTELKDQEHQLELSRIDALGADEFQKTTLRLNAEKNRIQSILDLNDELQGDLTSAQIQAMRNSQAKIDKEIADTQDAAKAKTIADGKELIEQQHDKKMSEIDLLKDTEAEKTKLRLGAERDRIQKILDLNKDSEGKLSKLQIQAMENTIAKINQEIAKVPDGGDLYAKLGISLDDDQKQAISDSATHALEIIQTVLDARLEAADKALEKAEQETSFAETRVDREMEARNNGYANDVISAQRELELAKKKEDSSLKQKKKAQKAQAIIDAAMQASSLVTATAEIWKGQGGIPFIGVGLATAATALMWGSFAAAKIKAASATKEQYGDGGLEFLEGGSHASGNDIPIGTTKKGKQRTAEGGEALAVINKKNTSKYRRILPSLIKSLNDGTYDHSYSNDFISENNKIVVSADSDFSTMENSLEAIRENGERRTYSDAEGRVVEVYKNMKRIYV